MSQISARRIPKFFEMARKVSECSDFHQHRLGAIIVYKGTKIAVGYNCTRTSPIQKEYNRFRKDYNVNDEAKHINSIHAEMMAIEKIKYLDIDFKRTAIFVYRATKDNRTALARPCEACMKRIKEIGIKDIYYTVVDGWEHLHIN